MQKLEFIESTLQMPFLPLPVRSVLVPLEKARVLISPGSKVDASSYRSELEVTDIVAPNLLHLAGVPKAKACYPSARVWAPPGARVKRPDINWDKELTEETWPHNEEMPVLTMEGMPKISEVLFLHRHSRSLLVTDLCFNLLDSKGLGPRFILGLFGTYQKLGVSRFYLSLVKDRKAFAASLERLFEWDFDDIIVSHGQNVKGNGKANLQAALKERGF